MTRSKYNDSKKTIAIYTYYKYKDGRKVEVKFVSRFASTIDIPYGKYELK